jgi:hypothetical protein
MDDLRILRRAYAEPNRRRYGKSVAVWLGAGMAVLGLWLSGWGEFAAQLLFRVWLVGGAAYALQQTASLEPLEDDDKISSFAALLLIAGILFVGLMIVGSILNLTDD